MSLAYNCSVACVSCVSHVMERHTMKIDLTKILGREDHSEDYSGVYEVDEIVFAGMPTPVEVQPLEVKVTNEGGRRLIIESDVSGRAVMQCSRCLKDVPQDFHFAIDEVFNIKDEEIIVDPDEDGEWLDEGEADIDQMI